MLGASQEEASEDHRGVADRDRQRFEAQVLGDCPGRPPTLLLSNAEDQARETGRPARRTESYARKQDEQPRRHVPAHGT